MVQVYIAEDVQSLRLFFDITILFMYLPLLILGVTMAITISAIYIFLNWKRNFLVEKNAVAQSYLEEMVELKDKMMKRLMCMDRYDFTTYNLDEVFYMINFN